MWTLFLLSLVIHHTWLAELGRFEHNMLKTVTSRALLVAVAIASVAELKRKETANLKPDIDVIIAK
jgi:hypothetical protein